MVKDDDLERRLLTEDVDGSENDSEEHFEVGTEKLQRRTRRVPWLWILAVAVLLVTNAASGLMGVAAGRRFWSLDGTCAEYTTQYCLFTQFYTSQRGRSLIPSQHLSSKTSRSSTHTPNSTGHSCRNLYIAVRDHHKSTQLGKLWVSIVSSASISNPWRIRSSLLTFCLDRAGVIPAEEGPRSGLTSAHVQRSDRYGGGFFVNVEGLHHLHCLVSYHRHFSHCTCLLFVNRISFGKGSISTTSTT